MSEMVERVAIAMYAVLHQIVPGTSFAYESDMPVSRGALEDMARAAIAEVHEPTDRALTAAAAVVARLDGQLGLCDVDTVDLLDEARSALQAVNRYTGIDPTQTAAER